MTMLALPSSASYLLLAVTVIFYSGSKAQEYNDPSNGTHINDYTDDYTYFENETTKHHETKDYIYFENETNVHQETKAYIYFSNKTYIYFENKTHIFTKNLTHQTHRTKNNSYSDKILTYNLNDSNHLVKFYELKLPEELKSMEVSPLPACRAEFCVRKCCPVGEVRPFLWER